MKRLPAWLFLCFLALGFASSCKDGADGKVTISLHWVYTPLYFADDSNCFPSTIVNEEKYDCEAGTYNVIARAWDGSWYAGSYTLEADGGEKGTLPLVGLATNKADVMGNGKDGSDRDYWLSVYSFGLYFYGPNVQGDLNKELSKSVFDQAIYDRIVNSDQPWIETELANGKAVTKVKVKKLDRL